MPRLTALKLEAAAAKRKKEVRMYVTVLCGQCCEFCCAHFIYLSSHPTASYPASLSTSPSISPSPSFHSFSFLKSCPLYLLLFLPLSLAPFIPLIPLILPLTLSPSPLSLSLSYPLTLSPPRFLPHRPSSTFYHTLLRLIIPFTHCTCDVGCSKRERQRQGQEEGGRYRRGRG